MFIPKSFILSCLIINFLLAKNYIIKFSHVVSPNTPKGKAAIYFAKRVEKLSKGKIKIEVYPNAILGSDETALRKLKFNIIQMAAPSFSKITSIVPQFSVFDLPFLFKNANHLHKILDGKIGKRLLKLVNKKGYIALGYWDNGFKELTNSKKPLIKPQDCKGLKFRIMNSKVLISQFKSLGAIPIILPFNEVYSALEQHIIDGEENTISNIYTKNFYKVQKYITLTNHGYLGYIVIINQDFWKKLPNNLKQIIKQAFKETTKKEREWAIELNNKQLKKIEIYAKNTNNLKIIKLTNQQRMIWKKQLVQIYPKFYKLIPKKLIQNIIKVSN